MYLKEINLKRSYRYAAYYDIGFRYNWYILGITGGILVVLNTIVLLDGVKNHLQGVMIDITILRIA